MNEEVSNILTKKLAAALAKEIDIEATAKRMAPKVASTIEKNLMAAFASLDWSDVANELMSNQRIWKTIQDFVGKSISDKLKT